jgi:predicted house-cleaning noncanonical NTP pyrophosphatase (MazG superfamily)
MRISYDKLIRDRVPELMAAEGVRFEVVPLDPSEFRRALLAKLVEEAVEAGEASDRVALLREIADVFEVLDALLALEGASVDQARAVQRERRETRGGFAGRLVLKWTET